jgi:hypothetical protein
MAGTTLGNLSNALIVVKTQTTSVRVLKSQVGLLVGGFGFAVGALALPALRWEHRPRGQMKIGQRVRYQRIGEGFAAIPALQKPFRHRLKIPRFSTKAYATENFRSKIYSLLSHEVSSCCYSVQLIYYIRRKPLVRSPDVKISSLQPEANPVCET